MAIVVEDGTQVVGANSYISEAELTAYATARAITLTGGTEALLLVAMDYIEAQSFKGDKLTSTQALQWPRDGVYIDGFTVAETEIPQLLKDALAETAIAVDQGNNPLGVIDRAVKREKLGELETEYMDNAASTTITPAITNKLAKLVRGGGGTTLPVIRV